MIVVGFDCFVFGVLSTQVGECVILSNAFPISKMILKFSNLLILSPEVCYQEEILVYFS